MKTKLLIVILVSILVLSCRTNLNYKSEIIANEIITEIHGSSGKLSFVEKKLDKLKDKQNIIELKINGLENKYNDRINQSILAIHCASELYKRLDTAIIKNYYGFLITFNYQNNISKSDSFFFEKFELKHALNAFSNIDAYLKYLVNDDTINVASLLDTNYFKIDVSKTNKIVKNIIGKNPFRTFYYYDYYNYSNKSGTKKFRCFNIVTVITRQDNSQSSIGFCVPIYENDNKIIMIQPLD